jgi:hypothetical protein
VNRHNSSFIGFAPVNNPRIVVVVTLNNTPQQGGIASAPVFARIAETALRVLQVPKDDPDNDIHGLPALPKEVNEEPEEQPKKLVEKAPEKKPEPAPGSTPGPYLVAGPRVPDFRGKPLVAVMRESAAMGMPVEIVGTGVARDQSPPPGGILPIGGRVHIQFARPQ